MPTQTIILPRPHQGQQRIKQEAKRFNAVACGRRFGKSTLGEELLITPTLEGYPTCWFSPTYKMLADIWRDVVRIVKPLTVRMNAQEHRIELATGGVIDMWSLDNPDAARGRKYRRGIIDEAAMIALLGDAWTAVIRPMLADYQGDLYALSTPRGRNFFHQMFVWGQDPLKPDWASWQMPTSTNPFIRPTEIAALRETMTERAYLQEIEAQFLEDAGGVLRRVREAATAQPTPRETGHQYVMGVDWGKSNDFTVLSVIDLQTKTQVALDRFNQIDYRVQLQRLQALCDRYQPVAIVAEQNSIGGPLIEQLQQMDLPVQPFLTTNATKAAIIDALALAFERGDLTILDDPVQTAELQAYEMERLPSGLMRYSAPEGQHDDLVIALALAWHAAQQPTSLLLW